MSEKFELTWAKGIARGIVENPSEYSPDMRNHAETFLTTDHEEYGLKWNRTYAWEYILDGLPYYA